MNDNDYLYLSPYDWEHPQWNKGGRVHNWHRYVSDNVKILWNSLTEMQKLALANNFQDIADNEEWD